MPDKLVEYQRRDTPFEKFVGGCIAILDTPVTIFREKVVEPIQSKNKTYYYHRRYRRVPNIDECEIGDQVCFFEANEQFKRDMSVDSEILSILRQRRIECEHWYGFEDKHRFCKKLFDDYDQAAANWFAKYGDLGAAGNVRDAYMKQKHRLIWERRHGEVGTGMKQ